MLSLNRALTVMSLLAPMWTDSQI